jgi:microcystin-dependent protein
MPDPYLGEIKMFAGNFAPVGFALCDGQLLAISQYSALFSLLGTYYGGDGITTFGLPDLRGRTPIHWGTGPGLSPISQGQTGGSETRTLTTNNLPSHSHTMYADDNTATAFDLAGNALAKAGFPQTSTASPTDAMASATIGNTGGAQSFNIRSPYQSVGYIIALQGIYPSRS